MDENKIIDTQTFLIDNDNNKIISRSQTVINNNILSNAKNLRSNTININNNLELKDLFNISKEVSLSRGEEDFIQKDILQEIEKSPKKGLSNGSFKFEEKNDKSKDSKESNENSGDSDDFDIEQKYSNKSGSSKKNNYYDENNEK